MDDSVDGVGIHQDGSDVYFDRPCESCSEDDKNVEAASFCPDCDTYLCQKCLKVHSRLASTKNHPILYGDDMPKSIDEKPVKYPPCKVHAEELLDMTCVDHDTLVCKTCKEDNHDSCNVKGTAEVSNTFDQARIHRLADTVADLRERAMTDETYLKNDFDKMEHSKKRMLSDVKELYTEAIDFILRLYKETQKEVEDAFSDRKLDIESNIGKISEYVLHLDKLSVDLNKMRRSKLNERGFIRFHELMANINESKEKILKADRLSNTEITFKINEEFQTFLEKCSTFGHVSVETTVVRRCGEETPDQNSAKEDTKHVESEKATTNDHASFSTESGNHDVFSGLEQNSSDVKPRGEPDVSKIEVDKRDQLNASSKEDKLACFITGIAIRENGDILVVDWNNDKIKLFASDGKLLAFLELSSFKLAYWPCDACFIDGNTAIVCLSGTNRLHILKISGTNTITLERTISLPGTNIWSATPYDLEIVVTCGSKPNAIKVLKMSGEVDWTIENDRKGQRLFENISGIFTLGKYSRKVVIADKDKASVSILNVDRGEILYACKSNDKIPKSVTVDQSNCHVYVYYKDVKDVLVWSEDLSRSICICNYLNREPAAISFDHQIGSLLVSYESCDTIDRIVRVFKK